MESCDYLLLPGLFRSNNVMEIAAAEQIGTIETYVQISELGKVFLDLSFIFEYENNRRSLTRVLHRTVDIPCYFFVRKLIHAGRNHGAQYLSAGLQHPENFRKLEFECRGVIVVER